jgi:hypothetical protein
MSRFKDRKRFKRFGIHLPKVVVLSHGSPRDVTVSPSSPPFSFHFPQIITILSFKRERTRYNYERHMVMKPGACCLYPKKYQFRGGQVPRLYEDMRTQCHFMEVSDFFFPSAVSQDLLISAHYPRQTLYKPPATSLSYPVRSDQIQQI